MSTDITVLLCKKCDETKDAKLHHNKMPLNMETSFSTPCARKLCN